MSASAIPLSTLATSRRWQINFLNVLPAIAEHAGLRFRHLPACHHVEAVSASIARACVDYAALAGKHQLHRVYAGSLATYAVKAVAGGRMVGGHMNSKDVLNPLAQRKRGFVVGSITPYNNVDGAWHDLLLESRRVSPADQACFNVDFAVWLQTWTRRDRAIIKALAGGHTTTELAMQFRLSPARISQLRRAYQQSWEQFQGDPPRPTLSQAA